MVSSIDGKVTGEFLSSPECADATEIYYRINKEAKANGFICGRTTMEGSFTGKWYPELDKYENAECDPDIKADRIVCAKGGFYAVAFDTHGKLGWRSDKLVDPDGDPGYDGAAIVEVLSQQVDKRYLLYLRDMNISYIFAGEDSIDIPLALHKLKTLLGCEALLLEGGSIINGAFERAGCVDELSLIVAPIVSGKDGRALFADASPTSFKLNKAESENGVLILNYKRS